MTMYVVTPQRLYLARLPDDDRVIDRVIVGTCLAASGALFLRGAFDPDTWDRWKSDPLWNIPQAMVVKAAWEEPGVVVRAGIMVPLKELPRQYWGPEYEGEEWSGRTPDPRDRGLLELGVLVRYEHAFRYASPRCLLHEVADMLNVAMAGGVTEPYEQGLAT